MADLTITVTAAQAARIKTAFGSRDENGDWVDATAAEVEQQITDFVKVKTLQYEEKVAQKEAAANLESFEV